MDNGWVRLSGFLSPFIVILFSISICQPDWLLENKFLKEFISHELVAVLTIILTVKFVAVASTHSFLNKIVRRLKKRDKEKYVKHEPKINKIRSEINSDAWTIFGAFFFCIVALIIKGAVGSYPRWDAAMSAVSLLVLLLNGFIFYDIYSSTFKLVKLIADLDK